MKIQSRSTAPARQHTDIDVLELISHQADALRRYNTGAEGVAHIAGLLAAVGSVDHLVDVRVASMTNYELRAFSVSWRMRMSDPFTNATLSIVVVP